MTRNMGRYVLYAVYVMLAATLLAGCGNRNNEVKDVLETESDTPGVGQHRLGFDPDTLSVFEGKVRRNEFFSNLLMRLGLEAQQAYGLSMATVRGRSSTVIRLMDSQPRSSKAMTSAVRMHRAISAPAPPTAAK